MTNPTIVQQAFSTPGKDGEILNQEATAKVISLLRASPAGSVVLAQGALHVIEALHADKLFLKSVIAKHEANMRELKQAYGVEVVDEEPPAEQPGGTDPKSLYSLL